MPFLKVGEENAKPIHLFFEDYGTGKPVILIHGYPLCGAAWEKQISALLDEGRRVIAYDRRGFGKSSQPAKGYDYDTFAADLNVLITTLALDRVTLVGHSMGSGEIARYLTKYGSRAIEKAIFISPLQPYLLKTADNPEGVDRSVFEGFLVSIRQDRFAFMTKFFTDFYNAHLVDKMNGHQVSSEAFENSMNVAALASPIAVYECVKTWLTDFRGDLGNIDVPSLIIHGTADRTVSYEKTAKRLAELLPGSRLLPIEGACHGLCWTHANEINSAIIDFLNDASAVKPGFDVQPGLSQGKNPPGFEANAILS